MRVIFVRHGETKEGKRGIILGSLGGSLTPFGRTEMKEIAHQFISQKSIPDIIISSPLQRALDSARILSSLLRVDIIQESLVRERSAGVCEGKKESDIDWEHYEEKPLLVRKHKGGESFKDVYVRAEKFLKKLRKQYKKETVLIVSHSVFILMCCAILKRKTVERVVNKKMKGKAGLLVIDFH